MKRYSRKAFIRYFEKLPPRSKPCAGKVDKFGSRACPLVVSGFVDSNGEALYLDSELTAKIDVYCIWKWSLLSAARIVRIAKELGE